MKPPDSITDGVVVLRKMREDDRAVFFRFGIGSAERAGRVSALRVVVLSAAVAAH
jgi:hypothetical protein